WEALDEPEADGLGDASKDDGDCLGRVLGRPSRRCADRHDRVDLEAHQFGREAGQDLVLSRRVAALKGQILPFHPPKVAQRFRECLSGGLRGRPRGEGWRLIREEADSGDLPRRLRRGGKQHREQTQDECDNTPDGAVPHDHLLTSASYRPSWHYDDGALYADRASQSTPQTPHEDRKWCREKPPLFELHNSAFATPACNLIN